MVASDWAAACLRCYLVPHYHLQTLFQIAYDNAVRDRYCCKLVINTKETPEMANEKKCAHTACRCMVNENEHYCSDYCKDAQKLKEDTEIQCDCKHEPCAL